MPRTLHIAPELSFPLDAVTQTFAIMAIRGVGKTHTASVMAEEMLKAGQPVCIYDPTGAWFGLKTSADGKRPGFQVVIFGGEHADVPLEENAGALIARVVVEKRISAILDVSLLRKGARIRFMTDFCEELYHRNREPLHLFLDEAHTVAPQNLKSMPEAARLVGALEDIVLQGRRRGLGITAITQRPALLNTNIRTQCGTLIVLRIIGPHDRKAIEEWIDAHATAAESAEVLKSLAVLKLGEGWVWSPAWLGILERVRFRQRETFDSSATPKVGEKVVTPQAVAAIDLDDLGEQIKATVERVKADDPKELRRRIAELEKSLKSAAQPAAPPAPDPKQIEALVIEGVNRQLARIRDRIVEDVIRKDDLWTLKALSIDGGKSVKLIKSAPAAPAPPVRAAATPAPPATASSPKQKIAKSDGMALSGPEQRILNAIAWFETIGVQEASQPSVAFLAGYSFTSSSFANARAMLRAKGLAEYLPGDLIRLTDEGRAHAAFDTAPRSNETLHSAVFAKLPGPERRLLEPLLQAWPKSLSAEHLAEKSGYSLTSSSFANARGSLKGFGLVEYPGPGLVRAKDLLFPEGA